MDRRSFLSLMAAAIAGGPAAIAASRANPVLPGWWMDRSRSYDWMVFRDHFVWVLVDELVIEPGKATNGLLFGPPVPETNLTVNSVGWAWPEDTPLADCRKLLEHGEGGMVLDLKCDGKTMVRAPAHCFTAGYGIRSFDLDPQSDPLVTGRNGQQLVKPCFPKGDFGLHVETPALDLSAPVKLQFHLCGWLAIEDWGRGGVPVPPA